MLVGHANAERYFKNGAAVELQLDHLQIECGLSREFWDGEAEIRDRRLCAWLESKRHRKGSERTRTVLLTPAGGNRFRVMPVSVEEAEAGEAAA